MAGYQAPLSAVQGAILKSAAGKHVAEAQPGTPAQLGAVAQDLAVMADQAQGYTAGILAGHEQAVTNRNAQNVRLDLERQQADQLRATQLEAERLQTARAQAAAEQARAEAAARSASASSAASEEAYKREKAVQAANAATVLQQARARIDPETYALVIDLVPSTTSFAESMEVYKNLKRHGAIPSDINDKEFENIAREYHKRLNPPTGGGDAQRSESLVG